MQKNPMQTLQGTMQGDLYFLHLVEDLAGEGGREADEDNERDRDVVLNGAEGGEAVVDEVRCTSSSYQATLNIYPFFSKDLSFPFFSYLIPYAAELCQNMGERRDFLIILTLLRPENYPPPRKLTPSNSTTSPSLETSAP